MSGEIDPVGLAEKMRRIVTDGLATTPEAAILTDGLGRLQLENRRERMRKGDIFFDCIPGCGHVPVDMVKSKPCGFDPWGKQLYSFTCPACNKFRLSILWRL